MQDYKSLCAAVTICATLVKIQTERHTDNIVSTYMNTSASGAKNQTNPSLVVS